MIPVFVVDAAGRILRQGTCQAHLMEENAMGHSIYEGTCPSPTTHYAPQGIVQERPIMPLVYAEGSVTAGEYFHIDGVPVGTELTHPEGSITVDDHYIEWSSEAPGTFLLYLNKFPYQDEVIYATFI